MRIILATEYYYPISKGGTEMYIHQLAKQFVANGHDCMVISLSNELHTSEFDNIKIKYIPFEKNKYNDQEHPSNLSELIKIVSDYSPDIFHLHTYTPSLGVIHLLKVKELGVRVFFTAHLPSFTCLRGDLMRFGTEVCDGIMIQNKCMNCYLHFTGISNELNRKFLLRVSKIEIFRKAISRLNQFQIKVDSLTTFKNNLEKIIVVSQWQKNIFILNGFEENSIAVCRQSIDIENIRNDDKDFRYDKVRIGFVGRIVNAKGLHLLLDILSEFDRSKFELNIIAIKSINEIEYYNSMKNKASVLEANWRENLNSEEVFNFLDNIDLLVVPSIMLETGPYVAFEALARKVPVLAFNYGGVREVINNTNGFLMDNPTELKEILHNIINNVDLLKSKVNNFNNIRTSEDLYLETIKIYSSI